MSKISIDIVFIIIALLSIVILYCDSICNDINYKKNNKYPVITLCGSTKFKDEFMEAQKKLTLDGNIVISVGCFGHSGDNEVWDDNIKEMLDDMHKRKIDLADAIMVINKDNYIGESTKSEIEYAKATGKNVYYWYR